MKTSGWYPGAKNLEAKTSNEAEPETAIEVKILDRFAKLIKWLAAGSIPPYEQDEFITLIFYHGAIEYLLENSKRNLDLAEIKEGHYPSAEERLEYVNLSSWLIARANEILNETKKLHNMARGGK